jgi:hypothetical protein
MPRRSVPCPRCARASPARPSHPATSRGDRILESRRAPGTPLLRGELGKIRPVHQNATLPRPVQTAEHLHQGRLARAVLTDQRHHDAGRELEVDTTQRRLILVPVPEAQPLQRDAPRQPRRNRRRRGRHEGRPLRGTFLDNFQEHPGGPDRFEHPEDLVQQGLCLPDDLAADPRQQATAGSSWIRLAASRRWSAHTAASSTATTARAT